LLCITFNTKPCITTKQQNLYTTLYCSKNIAVSTLIILWYYCCKIIVQFKSSDTWIIIKQKTKWQKSSGLNIQCKKIWTYRWQLKLFLWNWLSKFGSEWNVKIFFGIGAVQIKKITRNVLNQFWVKVLWVMQWKYVQLLKMTWYWHGRDE